MEVILTYLIWYGNVGGMADLKVVGKDFKPTVPETYRIKLSAVDTGSITACLKAMNNPNLVGENTPPFFEIALKTVLDNFVPVEINADIGTHVWDRKGVHAISQCLMNYTNAIDVYIEKHGDHETHGEIKRTKEDNTAMVRRVQSIMRQAEQQGFKGVNEPTLGLTP